MAKFGIGDLIEFIPGNYLFTGYNIRYWLEGTGLILDIENGNYIIRGFNLRRTAAKNLATYDIAETTLTLPIKECDEQQCFRSLEES